MSYFGPNEEDVNDITSRCEREGRVIKDPNFPDRTHKWLYVLHTDISVQKLCHNSKHFPHVSPHLLIFNPGRFFEISTF